MEEDDNSTILESSLFYSCMSSASATGFEEHDEDDAADHIEAKAAVPLPSSCQTPPAKDIDPSPLMHHEKGAASNVDADNIPSNPSSKSSTSWSVLSESERPKVRSITFNRDRSCLIVCTSLGVRVRTLESLYLSLQNLSINDDNHSQNNSWIHDVPLPPDGATYAQLLHNTSLLAVVKPSSPRCCFLYNAKNASAPLATLPLSAAVKRVELQRRVLAAMTVDLRLHVFHMTEGGGDVQRPNQSNDGTAEKKSIRPTLITSLNIYHPTDSPRNVTRGVDAFNAGSYFDLSTNEDEPYLICKSFNGTPGTVRVYDPTKVRQLPTVASSASVGSGSAKSTASSWDKYNSPPATKKLRYGIQLLSSIKTHDHSVTRMLIGGGSNNQQSFLATVSSKGTTIRVFGLPKGEYLWEWHRGSRPCQFYSLSWNGTADRLATFGSSGTIHIFDWQKKKQPPEMQENIDDDDVGDDGNSFQKVDNDAEPRCLEKAETTVSKPLLRRIGSSIKRRASSSNATPIKHRSFTKMKYKPSTLTAATPHANAARSQSLVLALLDRNHFEDGKTDLTEKDDDLRLVFCSMDGELRQYTVKDDRSIVLTQIEDVLARR